jgi:hypothetical protein
MGSGRYFFLVRFDVPRRWLWRMPSSGMWRRVNLVGTDVSEERIACIFRVEKSASEKPVWAGGSETSVHTRSTGYHIPEYGILHALFWSEMRTATSVILKNIYCPSSNSATVFKAAVSVPDYTEPWDIWSSVPRGRKASGKLQGKARSNGKVNSKK